MSAMDGQREIAMVKLSRFVLPVAAVFPFLGFSKSVAGSVVVDSSEDCHGQ
jgi:hypothetical protein